MEPFAPVGTAALQIGHKGQARLPISQIMRIPSTADKEGVESDFL
jgi:hypothetical protein